MTVANKRNDIEFQLFTGASAVLNKYGRVESLIENDGFKINDSFYCNLDDANLYGMSQSAGLAIIHITSILKKLKPDVLFVVGDRYEVMSAVIASAYLNIRIAHTMGGEVTGTIDESIRHAITKFSHYHFPANKDAETRIIKMGEESDFVFNYGCPRIDLVKNIIDNFNLSSEDFHELNKGLGKSIDLNMPFLLVSQHPVTTEFTKSRNNIAETLKAIKSLQIPTIILWPNSDAGTDELSKEIRTFREKENPSWLSIYRNLPVNHYIFLMNKTACLVGNSSSGIREGNFIGTPVVNIGSRQNKRLRGPNVINCKNDMKEIKDSILKQLKKGKHKRGNLYGIGNSGELIIDSIMNSKLPKIQKTIIY